jgi:hypothetical protein
MPPRNQTVDLVFHPILHAADPSTIYLDIKIV